MDILEHIKSLQFTDSAAAESLALDFLRAALPALAVAAVELRPLAVSLNSFNGFLTTTDGTRLFFKTHTEPDNVIGEYYNAAALADAGYPVLQPLYSVTEAGRQVLVYPVIDDPSVFDVAWQIEQGDATHAAGLTAAQHAADDQLYTLYQHTLQWQSAEDAARAPVHQLFHHRLTRGRLDRFYGAGTHITLPHGTFPLEHVRRIRWTINGITYPDTLDDIIANAVRLLEPAQSGASIIGHGDAHNGNVFYRTDGSLMYFDPAFAGRHDPILDLAKPLFHNVHAMWMYHPDAINARLAISVKADGDHWHVTHDFAPHPIRHMFWQSKIDRVLTPTLALLHERGWLDAAHAGSIWRERLNHALFCCAFLTMNLADAAKYPPDIALLGLAVALQMSVNAAY